MDAVHAHPPFYLPTLVKKKEGFVMRTEAFQTLEQMKLPNGLYVASLPPEYGYVWIRDNCYIALTYMNEKSSRYEKIFHAMLDIFNKYLWKLEHHARHRPNAVYEYMHPRYQAEQLTEVDAPWGNAQNDAIGLFLYGVGQGLANGRPMLRNESDRRIIQLLVEYLGTLEYWRDADNGIWEENREVHASSVGACVAGLLAVKPYVHVPKQWIEAGICELVKLAPRESAAKDVDLALLTLVYPYRVLPHSYMREVVRDVESRLLRSHGVIRYEGDEYYGEDNTEAQWCFGIPWLGLCYVILDDYAEAEKYLDWTERLMIVPGVLPELYSGRTLAANSHTPLAWGVAMYLQLQNALKHQANTPDV
jgi:GH15 family glucan-1,4-alpha-glucosidase